MMPFGSANDKSRCSYSSLSAMSYSQWVGTFVEQLEQQKVKGAAVHSAALKSEISSALGMR